MTGMTVPDSARAELDCALLPPAERFDAWTDAVNRSFVPLRAISPTSERARFDGALVAQPLGRAAASTVSGSAVRVSRERADIARADPGHIKLGLQLRGYSVITQDGRDAALAPGDFALYDTTRPYALDFDASFRMFVLMFPIEALRIDRDRLSGLTACRFSGRNGLGAIVSTFLRSLSATLDHEPLTSALPVSDAVFDLLVAAVGERVGTPDTHDGASRRALLHRVETFIAGRLDDPDLTVGAVADAHHVSVRYLQKLFEQQGDTVSGWIRRRRLETIRRDLANPALAGRQISTIGAQWGFADATAFSRAFRGAYGITPSEYRAQSLGH